MSEYPTPLVLIVQARDGQYQLRGHPGEQDPWPEPLYGLFVGEHNWVAILCGTEWGPVSVTVRVHRAEPGEIDRAWDMAAERTVDCDDGYLDLRELYSADEPARIPVPADRVRLRLSVRGRIEALNHGEPVTEPIEHHQLQLWPVNDQSTPEELFGPDSLTPLLG